MIKILILLLLNAKKVRKNFPFAMVLEDRKDLFWKKFEFLVINKCLLINTYCKILTLIKQESVN